MHASRRRDACIRSARVVVGAVGGRAPYALACRALVSDRALVPVLALRRVGSDCALLGGRVVPVIRARVSIVADRALLRCRIADRAGATAPEARVERFSTRLQRAADRAAAASRAGDAVVAGIAAVRRVGRSRRVAAAGELLLVLTPRHKGEAGHHEHGGQDVAHAKHGFLQFALSLLKVGLKNLRTEASRDHPDQPSTESVRLSVELLHSTTRPPPSSTRQVLKADVSCTLREPFPRTYNQKFI